MNRIYYSIYGPFINKFISLKNSLGYQYKDAGYALAQLDSMALKKGISTIAITKELAEEYSLRRPNESDKTRYNRIQIFAQFCHFICDLGVRSFIPRLPRVSGHFIPYIFSTSEMQTIFSVCDNLKPSFRHYNSAVLAVPILFRLLYGTGIRINEALHLSCRDININDKYLILRKTKGGKDRMVPMSDSLATECTNYLTYRQLSHGAHKSDRLFILPNGSSLSNYVAYKWFRRVLWAAKISHGGRGKGPRLHDLRHTFSVHSIALMAREGLDLYHSLPLLSTYLGHQSLDATDDYVRLTSEMYPDLITRSAIISANVFPSIRLNVQDDETY
jgi:integrase